jgi:predicted adenylyl cyclase CyaB
MNIMLEVEVRARVQDFGKIKEILHEKARFLGHSHQVDRTFGNPKFLDSEHKIIEGGIVARIREEGEKRLLEFKQIKRSGAAIEIKHDISHSEPITEFLESLGFQEGFSIRKFRDSYLYRDFHVCLDTVEQLGNFIEVEKVVGSEQEAGEVWKQCFEMLKELAPDSETEHRKYGDMMQELVNNKEKQP